jgi:hypothetical protein
MSKQVFASLNRYVTLRYKSLRYVKAIYLGITIWGLGHAFGI